MPSISDAKILILATDGFENSELFDPRETLMAAGATVHLASPALDPIQGKKHDKMGDRIKPDMTLDAVKASDYDALLLPGGVANPDSLRMEPKVIDAIRDFIHAEKPVAAICHAPWLLVEADVVRGKTVTGWPSVRTDLTNAGGNVVDQAVAEDGFLITSRKPDDIPAFTEALIEAIERR
ncbi:type 1 glutamine amidotransferase domain-containing protein [Sphingobium boeckii]|uniref:Protease I n=1 Tax=Sphingobium boeckii TaxID=1082345 RepID=A0A7W9EEG8_9SPHN|nr:type 1 glutamine amidotransferase domain-containing protein [Sphingobium boeckii]MBB5686029.1 protease I [Sphingobium boeckii]